MLPNGEFESLKLYLNVVGLFLASFSKLVSIKSAWSARLNLQLILHEAVSVNLCADLL